MQKNLKVSVITLILVAIGWAGIFYWNNLRGIAPALLPPPADIVELIDPVGTNFTDFPLEMPPGFTISIFAKDLQKPRVLVFDPQGNLLVSDISEGKVYALPDKNNDGKADEKIIVKDNLNNPHGLAFRCADDSCQLYIAETDQVAVYDYDNLKATNKRKILDLPEGGSHFSRTILFADDKLFTSVGSSCNVCDESDWRRAKVLVSNPDGSDFKVFAEGLRNSVFITTHPLTGKVWGTEMGRDQIGDDLPPDEINIIEKDKNYGWPYCYGNNIHDYNYDKNTNPCPEMVPSHIGVIPAHSSPLGLAFIPASWPQEYKDDLLVAFHGSIHRSIPTGYKIYRYKLDENGTYQGEKDFISGWLTEDNKALGRPVDLVFAEDGTLFLSDDKAGLIYTIKPSSVN